MHHFLLHMINYILHRRFYLIAIFLLCMQLLISCQQKQRVDTAEETSPDISITVSNAYSSLFLDSIAVENFISTEAKEKKVANYLRSFYNSRNYSFAWFDEDGLTEHAQAFWDAHNNVIKQYYDSTIYDRALHQVIDTLLNDDSAYQLTQSQISLIELRFTKHIFQYVQFAYGGKVNPEEVQWHIPRRKLKPTALIDSFLNNQSGEWKGLSSAYRGLQKELLRYNQIKRKGGWSELPSITKTYKPGTAGNIIVALKKRLQQSGDYTGIDTSNVYTSKLAEAVKRTQAMYGLKQNGIIDKSLIKHLNIPTEDRIQQMLLNLERMKWMPEEPSKYLLANIPEYRLHVFENGKEALAMNIVVGKAVNRTVIFSNELKYVVFSPYWNVPRSIVRNEIYPAMKRSSSYLRRNNMEVTGYSGGLPVVRQKPGGGNALGGVKFIFPNSYNIYFHDTPSRYLFNSQKRAFSHGCVRLEQPFDLAVYLLRKQPEWTEKKIKAAMNRSTEKWVALDKTVPVFITYFTAWVDRDGLLHFAEDIYGHDKRLAKHLFE